MGRTDQQERSGDEPRDPPHPDCILKLQSVSDCLDDDWWVDWQTDKYTPPWTDEDYILLVSALPPL